MKKKGSSHVDWAISMGIFLVFIMLTIIFLRPGSQPTDDAKVLVSVVEKGLNKNSSFALEKGFMVIEPDIPSDGEYWVRIKNPTINGLNPDWKIDRRYLGLIDGRLGTIPNEDLPYLFYDFKNEYCDTLDTPADCTDAVEVDDTPDVLDMKLFLTTGKNVFWIIYSEDATYPIPGDPVDYDYNRDGNPDNDPDNYEDVWIRYEPEDIPNRCRGSDQNIPCLLDKISVGDENGNFTYEFGVVETQRGLFTLKLEEIDGLTDYLTQGYPDDPDDYDKLKKSWGLPEDKNFQIVIEEQRR